MKILRSQSSLAVVVWVKKPNDHAEPTKVERKKKKSDSIITICIACLKHEFKFFIIKIKQISTTTTTFVLNLQ